MNGSDIRSFRRLRRRKDHLEREIYDNDAVIRMSRNTPGDAAARGLEVGWIIENQERQEEIDEINYVLDFFDRRTGSWTMRSHIVLLLLSAVVIALAIVAIVRLF